MSESTVAAIVGTCAYLLIRLIDYLLPKNRHWRFVERWSSKDTNEEGEDAE